MAPGIRLRLGQRLPEKNLLSIQSFRSADIQNLLQDVSQLLNVFEIVEHHLRPVEPRLALDFQTIVDDDIDEASNYTSLQIHVAIRLYQLESDNQYLDVRSLIARFRADARAALAQRAMGNINQADEEGLVDLIGRIHLRGALPATSQAPPPTSVTHPIETNPVGSVTQANPVGTTTTRRLTRSQRRQESVQAGATVPQGARILRLSEPEPTTQQTRAGAILVLRSTSSATKGSEVDKTSNDDESSKTGKATDITNNARNEKTKAEDNESANSDGDDGSEDEQPKNKNHPGPKGYNWEGLEGFVPQEAKRGKADPSLFVITLRGTHRKTLEKIVYSWAYQQNQMLDFDWNNSSHVSKLNRWRSQIVRRRLGHKAHEYRESWTEDEANALNEILTDILGGNGNNYYAIDWENVATRLNSQFADRTIPRGSIIAISSTKSSKGKEVSKTKGGTSLHDRQGAGRNANACRNQAEKLDATRSLIEAAKANKSTKRKEQGSSESSAKRSEGGRKNNEQDQVKTDNKDGVSSSGITDNDKEEDNKKDDAGDDNGDDEDESPRGPSKRSRYFH